ncbi:hypothetical protein ABVN80_05175 [Acinetobacter baumannii]
MVMTIFRSATGMDVQLAKYQDRFEIAQLRQTVVTLGDMKR